MECKQCDSNKLCKVFDASRRSNRKNGIDVSNSDTDASKSISSKQPLDQNTLSKRVLEKKHSSGGSSSGVYPSTLKQNISPTSIHQRSTRRKQPASLALKAGCVSTPRSDSLDVSPRNGGAADERAKEADSGFLFEFLEEALKKKKHKHHSRRREEKTVGGSASNNNKNIINPAAAIPLVGETREHKHKRKSRRHEEREMENAQLLETFVKMLSQAQEPPKKSKTHEVPMRKSRSQRSFQCQCNEDYSDIDRRPSRLHEHPRDVYHKITVRESESGSVHEGTRKNTSHSPPHYSDSPRTEIRQIRSRHYFPPGISDDKNRYCDRYDDRIYDDRKERYDRSYDRDRVERNVRSKEDRRWCDEMQSRCVRDRYQRRLEDDRTAPSSYERDDRSSPRRRPDDCCPACRDCETRARRHSGVSLCESGRASDAQPARRREEPAAQNAKKSFKELQDPNIQREVQEQREALDKMMRLWQELMRRFKDMTENVGRSERVVQDTAAAARECAATQAQLWRECMQRYESVARDVGDTDARLMEEIQKQKSEISEMSNMWQECLSKYREVCSHLTTLKQQIGEQPAQRAPAAPGEGEGYTAPPPPQPYANMHHHTYPVMYATTSPVRARVSAPQAGAPPPAPPPWWWRASSPGRRGSSAESRSDCSHRRERRHHRHRERERDRERYKDRRHASRDRKESECRTNPERRRKAPH